MTASSGTGRAAQRPRHRLCRSRQRRRRGIVAEIGGATPGDSHRAAAVRESRPRQRLDEPEAGGRQDEPRGDRRANQGDRRERRTWNPIDPSHGRQRRLFRRLAARAAHRPRQVGADRRARDLVAGQQHAPALRGSGRIRSSRSPNSPRTTPRSNGARCVGGDEEGRMTRHSRGSLVLLLALSSAPVAGLRRGRVRRHAAWC